MTDPAAPHDTLRAPQDPAAAPSHPGTAGEFPDVPVLVEVWRSGFPESAHRGAWVVLDAKGGVQHAVGPVGRPTLPRSSNKPVQATALLAAGWTPRSAQELAIGAGSHTGEPGHVSLALEMLAAVGLTEDDLGCPPALPADERERATWLVEGRAPRRAAMNCSGKHAAMLSACVAAGWPTQGYLDPAHPLQLAVAARLGEAGGEPVSAVVVDGCGAPQHALSVTALARGVLSLVQAPAGSADRAVADAMRAHPWLVAGTGKDDTRLMGAVPDLLVKGGADGVHVAALPGRGAVALKLEDGGDRGRMPALAAGLAHLGVSADLLAPFAQAPVSGGEGTVGSVRPAAALGVDRH